MLSTEEALTAIAEEIRQRRVDAGRLSLVTFNENEYSVLRFYARHIVRNCDRWFSSPQREDVQLIFLAFTMAFVRRNKYTDDNVFWSDFEKSLGLRTMQFRYRMMDELWSAYKEEGLERSCDGRGRRIVGTLLDEMRQAKAWVTQARDQFVDFFQWYYGHHPESDITPQLLKEYKHATGVVLQALDKVLPTLTRDCQRLAKVIDFAIERDLYLRSTQLDGYRQSIVAALGPEYDPTDLRLIRDERTLVRLILELQNPCTPAQFEKELNARRNSYVHAPWGQRLRVSKALERWTPFPYGVYRIESEEYRVVPYRRLRLEILEEWSFEEVVSWRGGRYLGYKKHSPFQVTIGRRPVDATQYFRSRSDYFYVWVGKVPTGQKLAIDGRLRRESAGSEWDIALRLDLGRLDQPQIQIAVTRLMLYYPDRAFQPIRIWASTGFEQQDHLREDGVRRFHLHRRLVIPLDAFEEAINVGVQVRDEEVLSQRFEPEAYYLFSMGSRERVQAREMADLGDREYVLFTREDISPKGGPGVGVERLPGLYGTYARYRVTWEDASCPFELQAGSDQWSFEQRREFAVLLNAGPSLPHIRLKPHQCVNFHDLSLQLYCTFDFIERGLRVEVSDEEGLLGEINLSSYMQSADAQHFFRISPAIWDEVKTLTGEHYGRYRLCFRDGDAFLSDQVVTLMPLPILESWNEDHPYLESAPFKLTLSSPDCKLWNTALQKSMERATYELTPHTHAEPCPKYSPLRRVVSEPISVLASFPDLGETLEIVIQPPLFGYRLYLQRQERAIRERPRTSYQPVQHVDYYNLQETALYVFSTPHTDVGVRVGAWEIFVKKTDEQGDLLLPSLSELMPACLNPRTTVTVYSSGVRTEFIVHWAPILHKLAIKGEEVILTFNGPEGTAIRLRLRELAGKVAWTKDVPCEGGEVTTCVELPDQRPSTSYLTVGYVLTDGSEHSAAAQMKISNNLGMSIPVEWLTQGVGVTSLEHL
jgi:hypothetical protein